MCEIADQKLIETTITELFGKQIIISVTRMGGMTNRTYKVTLREMTVVVRLPGAGTESLINRIDEKKSTELACRLGIDAKLYYFDEKTGIKVSEFINQSTTMNKEELQKDENLIKIAHVLKRLHSSNHDTNISFDIVDMAQRYENIIKNENGDFPHDYNLVKSYIKEINDSYLRKVLKVPCHNDPLCENWILQNKNKLYLIDWEYAGMNDPMWDLADISIEAELSEEQEDKPLTAYLGRHPMQDDRSAILANKVLIDYLWSLWGRARAVYDGVELVRYSEKRYLRMQENMKRYSAIKRN